METNTARVSAEKYASTWDVCDFELKGRCKSDSHEHSKHMIDAIEVRVKSIGETWTSQPWRSSGKGLDHPPLMTPVHSQAETVFSFSEILFYM
jgi:hypothetical protein